MEGHTSILTTAVVKEIRQLEKHMQKGCLSGIPTRFGTNRNENLHRSLNHRLAGHRIGVELAVALLSVFFHTWNAKRSEQGNTSICASFLKYSPDSTATSSSTPKHDFGIGYQLKGIIPSSTLVLPLTQNFPMNPWRQ